MPMAALSSDARISTSPLGPPSLPYNIRDHKLNIIIIWTLLVLDSAILPLALFYPLYYATSLREGIIFAITTSVFGLISGLEWAYRSWQLLSRDDVRPLGVDGYREGKFWWRKSSNGQRWWGFDFFHWSYTIGYTIAIVSNPHHHFWKSQHWQSQRQANISG